MVSKFTLNTHKSAATNAAITRTLEIANNYAGELSIEVLSLDKVELDPENKRDMLLTLSDAMHGIQKDDPQFEQKTKDWHSLESLAKTIRDDQLINPIFVYRFGNKCRLIAGERRTLASAIAGKKEIIARIAGERPKGTKLRVLQWIENNERQDLGLAERISSLESIIEAYCSEKNLKSSEKITAVTLSELTGMSVTQSRRYNIILQSKPFIKTAVMEGKIENIKLIELIACECSEENQVILLNAAIAGQSFEKILTLRNELHIGKKLNKVKNPSRKGGVSLGKVSPSVIRMLVDALMSSEMLDSENTRQINTIAKRIQWQDTSAIARAFKQITVLLEQDMRVPA